MQSLKTIIQTQSRRVVESLRKKPTLAMIMVVLSLGLIVTVGTSTYLFLQNQKLSNTQSKPADPKEIETLVNKVSRLMELPDEEPTIATVSDKDKLKEQAFFSKSENGDKVLIFTTSGKAILYRPSADKIIDVTNIRTSDETVTSGDTAIE